MLRNCSKVFGWFEARSTNSTKKCILGSNPYKPGPGYKPENQVPLATEVIQLNKKFKDPEKIIRQLVRPMCKLDESAKPCLKYKSRYNGRVWRVSLRLTWPRTFWVAGISEHKERSKHYAYLIACQMLMYLGVLTRHGEIINTKELLLKVQDQMFLEIRERRCHFESSKQIVNDRSKWSSVLTLHWPFSIQCCGQGATREDAEQHACVEAFIKLKTQGQLSPLNDFYIQHRTIKPVINQPVEMVQIDPDYEIYVDASMYGYGGYLIDRRAIEGRGHKVRWFQEIFPSTEDFSQKFKLHTNFLEFYGIVCCLFTWKKKFEGKRVLCRTDNTTAVNLINYGLRVNTNPERQYMRKLFLIFNNICWQYNIQVHAKHLPSSDNRAADCLSRAKTREFHEIIPNAMEKAKKTKQLNCFKPMLKHESDLFGLEIQQDRRTLEAIN